MTSPRIASDPFRGLPASGHPEVGGGVSRAALRQSMSAVRAAPVRACNGMPHIGMARVLCRQTRLHVLLMLQSHACVRGLCLPVTRIRLFCLTCSYMCTVALHTQTCACGLAPLPHTLVLICAKVPLYTSVSSSVQAGRAEVLGGDSTPRSKGMPWGDRLSLLEMQLQVNLRICASFCLS